MERQNEQGKEKRSYKLNILDYIIICFLVLACAAVIVRVYTLYHPLGNSAMESYSVTVRMESVLSSVPASVKDGDTAYFKDGRVFGTVIAGNGEVFKIQPAEVVLEGPDGQYCKGSYPDGTLVDAVGTLICAGFVDANGYFLCDGITPLIPGQTFDLKTELADFTVTVISVASD